MSGEVPYFKRCCFCLPLRYGLIVWGYLKAISSSFFIVMTLFPLLDTIDDIHRGRSNYVADLVFESTIFLFLVTDLVLTLVFIIGGHRKNVMFLKIYYHYNRIMCALFVLFMTVSIGFSIHRLQHTDYSTPILRKVMYIFLDFCMSLANIGLQAYFVLLLRSEIIKLKSNCDFRFMNHAADAECTIANKGQTMNGQKEIEAV